MAPSITSNCCDRKGIKHFRMCCYRKIINSGVATITHLVIDYFPVTAQHRVFDFLLNSCRVTLAISPSKVRIELMWRIGISHKTFVNKALFSSHVFKRTKLSLPGILENQSQHRLSKKTSHSPPFLLLWPNYPITWFVEAKSHDFFDVYRGIIVYYIVYSYRKNYLPQLSTYVSLCSFWRFYSQLVFPSNVFKNAIYQNPQKNKVFGLPASFSTNMFQRFCFFYSVKKTKKRFLHTYIIKSD